MVPGTNHSVHKGTENKCCNILYIRFMMGLVSVCLLHFILTLAGESIKLISVYIHLQHFKGGFGIRISTSLTVRTEVKLRTISPLWPRSLSLPLYSQSSVLCVASLRAMILYTLSLKPLSEVSRRAVSLRSSMLPPSTVATAKDLECFTAERRWNVENNS